MKHETFEAGSRLLDFLQSLSSLYLPFEGEKWVEIEARLSTLEDLFKRLIEHFPEAEKYEQLLHQLRDAFNKEDKNLGLKTVKELWKIFVGGLTCQLP